MSRIELIYQGLADLNVQIEDTTISSPDYFQVTKMPLEFNSGINNIRFKGNPEKFREGTLVDIEVLDVNGDPVYYEVNLDLESEEQAAIISVYITSDVPPGTGRLILCSAVYKDFNGNILDDSQINLRWSYEIYIDPSKRNSDEIIYDELPTVAITSEVKPYLNLSYPSGTRFINTAITKLNYAYSNGTGAVLTSSLSNRGFDTTGVNKIQFNFSGITNASPTNPGTILSNEPFTSSLTVIDSGKALLQDFIAFDLDDFNQQYIPRSAVINTSTLVIEQSASLPPAATENYHNFVTAEFTNLDPIIGTVAKIRSYYKSTGIGEYELLNESDIDELEFGFTPTTASISFAVPTIHRSDTIDFKFEFINPTGYIGKQVVESRNHTLLGGNTYISGIDNLLTGSLFVADNTGNGIHIEGRENSSLIRTVGYNGFENAMRNALGSGFLLYSGSIQSSIDSIESYTGTGVELVANSHSYFRYTTSGSGLVNLKSSLGLYDIDSRLKQVVPMIDTELAIIDATNIARTVFFSCTEYAISGNRPANEYLPADSSSLEFIFQGLKNEIKYTVAFQQKLEVTNDLATETSASLRFRLYAASSGSSNTADNYDSAWNLVDSIESPILSLDTAGITSCTFSEGLNVDQRTINLTGSLDEYQGKLLKGVIDFKLVNDTNSYTASFKNITVTAGRHLYSSWYETLGYM